MVTHVDHGIGRLVLDFFRNRLVGSLPEAQTPEAYTILCSDSRVQTNQFSDNPANMVFSTETIGNQVIGVFGSAGYPTSHLNSIRLICVVGHIRCGAVGGAYDLSKTIKPDFHAANAEDAITRSLQNLSGSRRLIYSDAEEAIHDELLPMANLFANSAEFIGDDKKPYLPKHAELNVHFQIAALLKLKELREKVASGELMVIGTVYDFLGRYGKPGSSYIVNINGEIDAGKKAADMGLHYRRFLA